MASLTKQSGQAHLASATLPAGGALTSQSALPLVKNQIAVVCMVTYTYGAANGFVRLQPMWTFGAAGETQGTFQDTNLDTSAPPYGRQTLWMAQVNGPVPSSSSALTFPVTFQVPPGATAFRLLAAEAGVTGTPGTCAISVSGVVDA